MIFNIMIILLSSLLINAQLLAESWSADKVYHSGDIVEFKGKSYLASYGSQDLQPINNKVAWDGWVTIKNRRLAQWKKHKSYPAGSVITFNDENYIAKWSNKNSAPDANRALWVKLVFGEGEEAGADDKDNILGKDKDANGIRDSYELFVNKKYKDTVVKQYLKSAAREYQKVLELHLDPDLADSMTTEQADTMMNELVAFLKCNRELRNQGKLPLSSSPITEYYNTIERAIGRHNGERILHHKLNEDFIVSVDRANPCGSITNGEL